MTQPQPYNPRHQQAGHDQYSHDQPDYGPPVQGPPGYGPPGNAMASYTPAGPRPTVQARASARAAARSVPWSRSSCLVSAR